MSTLTVYNRRDLATGQIISGDLFSRWVSYVDASPKTVATYTRAIRRFSSYLESRGVTQPCREDVIAYRDHLRLDHKPTTVQAYIEAVKLFFTWTAQEGIYPNVADHVKGAKLDTEHKKDPLTVTQVRRVLDGVDLTTRKGLRDYAMLSLMATTGLRTISIIRANIGDLRTVGDTAVLFHQGKGHEEKSDYVKLAPEVEDCVTEYLQQRGESDPDAPLFGAISNRNSGGRMTTRSVSRVVKDRLVSSGMDSDRLTAHSLRHTAATLMLVNGASITETQQILGHKNINTTMIYSHALDRAKNNGELRAAGAIFHRSADGVAES